MRCSCCCAMRTPTTTRAAHINTSKACPAQARQLCHGILKLLGQPASCLLAEERNLQQNSNQQASWFQSQAPVSRRDAQVAANLQSKVSNARAQPRLLPEPVCFLALILETQWAPKFGSAFRPRCQSQNGTNIEGTHCGFPRSWCHKLPRIMGPDWGPANMRFLRHGARCEFDPPAAALVTYSEHQRATTLRCSIALGSTRRSQHTSTAATPTTGSRKTRGTPEASELNNALAFYFAPQPLRDKGRTAAIGAP